MALGELWWRPKRAPRPAQESYQSTRTIIEFVADALGLASWYPHRVSLEPSRCPLNALGESREEPERAPRELKSATRTYPEHPQQNQFCCGCSGDLLETLSDVFCKTLPANPGRRSFAQMLRFFMKKRLLRRIVVLQRLTELKASKTLQDGPEGPQDSPRGRGGCAVVRILMKFRLAEHSRDTKITPGPPDGQETRGPQSFKILKRFKSFKRPEIFKTSKSF